MRIKVGIFFGGPSREREISFAGGRTVYDNLNKALFEPVPIFIDSRRNMVLLDWPYLYKGSIRDFYPPVDVLPPSPHGYQIYSESLGDISTATHHQLLDQIGTVLDPAQLAQTIDVAFLSLHGEYGEDGQIQARLQDLGIPYTGSGIRASEIGMDKALQKELMAAKGFSAPRIRVLDRESYLGGDISALYEEAVEQIGFPIVIRPANQGSSIGVSIVEEREGIEGFERAVNRAFFRELIPLEEWQQRDEYERREYVRLLGDLRDGLGFPLEAHLDTEQTTLHHPEELFDWLDQRSAAAEGLAIADLRAFHDEERVILESFIQGKEFSCIVLRREDGSVAALPPTEIVKGGELFDYRSKYLPGLSRKLTPIDLPADRIEAIREECARLFSALDFQVYARIDGFHGEDGSIHLNDPNTTSGMLPSSFFFHQAAEIGLTPSQFLTYIIRQSLWERGREPGQAYPRVAGLLAGLDHSLTALRKTGAERRRIAVIFGGYSFERHISVESGRNVFEKLSSSSKYEPIPVFLSGNAKTYELHRVPINLMLKDNADDIRDKVLSFSEHPVLDRIRKDFRSITQKYATSTPVFEPQTLSFAELAKLADGVFIALHGRPGEDGQLQMELEAHDLPYNGSGIQSSSLTIDKYRTLQVLKEQGLPVTDQLLLPRAEFVRNADGFFQKVEKLLGYPLIAKPVDDGCSSAVKVLRGREELAAYAELTFLGGNDIDELAHRKRLKLKRNEEFPDKTEILFERLITRREAIHFLEVTGGMLTHYRPDGSLRFEVFEPSEVLAGGEVLSLEEKFLAGEGQNITPARLAVGDNSYEYVAERVKADLEKAARTLGVEGYCRIDAFVRVYADGRVETLVIEVNSLPGMTPATAIFHQAALAGYKPYEFIDKLINFGFGRAAQAGLFPAERAAEVSATASQTVAPLAPGTRPAVAPRASTLTAIPMEKTTVNNNSNGDASPRFGNSWNDKHSPGPPRRLTTWQKVLGFFRSPIFLKNLGAILLLSVLSLFLLQGLLSWYTNHGESIQVQNYVGMQLAEAKQKAREKGLRIRVIEAAFDPDREPGIVTLQEPAALSRVKRKRSVYLTVTGSQPKEVQLPTLVGNYDYEQYTQKLDVLKIRYAIRDKVYDPRQEENTILHFYYKGRKITDEDLRGGVRIPQGETLDFVVTVRQTGEVNLPNLRCRRYGEVRFLLGSLNLIVGEVEGVSGYPDDAYVVEQDPAYAPGRQVPVEATINLRLSTSRPDDCGLEETEPVEDLEEDGFLPEEIGSPIYNAPVEPVDTPQLGGGNR